MAAAIYNKLTDSQDAVSAGTHAGSVEEPEGQVLEDLFADSPYYFELMEHNGLHVRQNVTTKLTPEMMEKADVVVSMAEEPFVPDFLRDNERVIRWKVQNPDFFSKEVVEETYGKILGLVQGLMAGSRPPSR